MAFRIALKPSDEAGLRIVANSTRRVVSLACRVPFLPLRLKDVQCKSMVGVRDTLAFEPAPKTLVFESSLNLFGRDDRWNGEIAALGKTM